VRLLEADELAVCVWDRVKLGVWLTLAVELALEVPDVLGVPLLL